MKKSITMLAALAPFLAIIAADKPEKSPEEESAEKAARVRAMAAEYAPCTVNVRFRMKTLQDGSRPDAWMQYRCPACGFERPQIDYDASGIRLSPQLSFDVKESGTAPVKISAPLNGFYNVYNILAVYSVLREMNLPTDRFSEILRSFRPQFGRGEVFHLGTNSGQRVLLNLAKNPAGFNQNISAMLQDRSPKDLIIVINDNAQDGRDVSWLWDVDFDRLADETIRSITVSGLRALDMQLRLKYVEIDSERAPDVEKAIDERLKDGCENLYVLVNYTALYEAHKYLEGLEK